MSESERSVERGDPIEPKRSGYDSREMAKLFLRLHERADSAARAQDLTPLFLRAHPYHRERYESVLRQYDQLQRDDPRDDLYIGVENLRRRIARSDQTFE